MIQEITLIRQSGFIDRLNAGGSTQSVLKLVYSIKNKIIVLNSLFKGPVCVSFTISKVRILV